MIEQQEPHVICKMVLIKNAGVVDSKNHRDIFETVITGEEYNRLVAEYFNRSRSFERSVKECSLSDVDHCQ